MGTSEKLSVDATTIRQFLVDRIGKRETLPGAFVLENPSRLEVGDEIGLLVDGFVPCDEAYAARGRVTSVAPLDIELTGPIDWNWVATLRNERERYVDERMRFRAAMLKQREGGS